MGISITGGDFERFKAYVIADIRSRIITIDSSFFQHKTRVIVFSPHPDDDVISAGAATISLSRSKNIELHVAYCVSGAVAVPDSFVMDELNRFKVEIQLENSDG